MNLPVVSDEVVKGIIAQQRRDGTRYVRSIIDEMREENPHLFNMIDGYVKTVSSLISPKVSNEFLLELNGFVIAGAFLTAKAISTQSEVNELNSWPVDDRPIGSGVWVA